MAEDKDIDLKNLSKEEINKLFNDIIDMPEEYKLAAASSPFASKTAVGFGTGDGFRGPGC